MPSFTLTDNTSVLEGGSAKNLKLWSLKLIQIIFKKSLSTSQETKSPFWTAADLGCFEKLVSLLGHNKEYTNTACGEMQFVFNVKLD
jgi:hypothetical protein